MKLGDYAYVEDWEEYVVVCGVYPRRSVPSFGQGGIVSANHMKRVIPTMAGITHAEHFEEYDEKRYTVFTRRFGPR